MANLIQLSYTRQNNNIKARYSHTRAVWALQKGWPAECSLPILSANLIAIFLLCALKNIKAEKIFLITPQNEATLQRKQISKNKVIAARAFIGILQNIFRSWAVIFAHSAKVVFLRNSAYLLKLKYFKVMFNIFEFSRVWENVV